MLLKEVKPQGKNWWGCPGSGQAQPGTPHSRSGTTKPITDFILENGVLNCFSKLEIIAGTA